MLQVGLRHPNVARLPQTAPPIGLLVRCFDPGSAGILLVKLFRGLPLARFL